MSAVHFWKKLAYGTVKKKIWRQRMLFREPREAFSSSHTQHALFFLMWGAVLQIGEPVPF
jgi:hypothetical protein